MFRRAFLSLAALVAALAFAPAVEAEGLPFESTLSLGRPLRPVQVTLVEARAGAGERNGRTGPELTLVSAGKRRRLPVQSASEITVERVLVAEDAAVAILHIKGTDGRWVGVLAGRAGSELVLFERMDPIGDPGERRAREVDVSGEPALVRTWLRYEGVSLCERSARFSAARLDPVSMSWIDEPAVLSVGKIEQGEVSVVTAAGAPPALALAAVSSSELDEATKLPRAPRALVDGDATRGVVLRPGAFAVLRWEGGALPIERLELALAGKSGPVELWWWDAGETAARVRLPAHEGPMRVSVRAARPVRGRCLTLFVPPTARADGEAGGAREQSPDEARAQSALDVRELYAYSELDRKDGLDRLIGRVVQDGSDAADAASLLEKLGPAAAERLSARWDELSTRAKRRSLKVLGRALDRESVRRRVLEAAGGEADAGVRERSDVGTHAGVRERSDVGAREQGDKASGSPRDQGDAEALREAALATLARGGEAGRAALRELAASSGPGGDAAARSLAAYPDEAPALLAALARTGGAERAGLRAALIAIARRDPARFRPTAAAWLTGVAAGDAGAVAQTAKAAAGEAPNETMVGPSQPSVEAVAALALVAAEAGQRELAATVAEARLTDAERFDDRFRLALALTKAAPSKQGDAWLVQQAEHAGEWMQRRAALDALAQRRSPSLAAIAEKLARDPYPRVRAAALAPLAASDGRELVEHAVANDPWPLVRAEGARALAQAGPKARGALQTALSDRAPGVRRAAIETLRARRESDAWSQIAPRLTARKEVREVREAAIGFAQSLCVLEAREQLVVLASKLDAADASEEDQQLAVEALRALHDLGGEAARQGAALVHKAQVPELTMLWTRLPAARCERGERS